MIHTNQFLDGFKIIIGSTMMHVSMFIVMTITTIKILFFDTGHGTGFPGNNRAILWFSLLVLHLYIPLITFLYSLACFGKGMVNFLRILGTMMTLVSVMYIYNYFYTIKWDEHTHNDSNEKRLFE